MPKAPRVKSNHHTVQSASINRSSSTSSAGGGGRSVLLDPVKAYGQVSI